MFLSAYKLACSTNGIDESAAMSFFCFIMKGLVAAALNVLACPKRTSSLITPKENEEVLRTHPEVENYLI